MFNFCRTPFPAYVLQTPNLQDERVRDFQNLFNKRSARYNISVEETGIYDSQTQEAVSSYQLRVLNILNLDGLIGPQTARRLGIRLTYEDTSG